METFFSTFWNGLINTYTKEKLVIIITCRAPCVHFTFNKKCFPWITLLLCDNSDMWRIMASLPDCPLVSSLSDVSSEWPRAPPFPGPGPVTRLATPGHRSQDPSGPGVLENIPDKKWPEGNKHSEVNYRGSGANQRPDADTSSQWEEGWKCIAHVYLTPWITIH